MPLRTDVRRIRDHHHAVATAEFALQVQRGAEAADLAIGHDSDAVRKHVRFLHGVRGEDHGAVVALLRAFDDVPHLQRGSCTLNSKSKNA